MPNFMPDPSVKTLPSFFEEFILWHVLFQIHAREKESFDWCESLPHFVQDTNSSYLFQRRWRGVQLREMEPKRKAD